MGDSTRRFFAGDLVSCQWTSVMPRHGVLNDFTECTRLPAKHSVDTFPFGCGKWTGKNVESMKSLRNSAGNHPLEKGARGGGEDNNTCNK